MVRRGLVKEACRSGGDLRQDQRTVRHAAARVQFDVEAPVVAPHDLERGLVIARGTRAEAAEHAAVRIALQDAADDLLRRGQ